MKRYLWMTMAAAGVLLGWWLAIADPCLIAFLRGMPDGAANPIAITACRVSPDAGVVLVTNGDVIVRLGALFLISGLLALVLGLVDPARNRSRVVKVVMVGFVVAGTIYLVLDTIVFGLDAPVTGASVVTLLATTAVTCGGAMLGWTQAEATWREAA
jgi:hypothetical protein